MCGGRSGSEGSYDVEQIGGDGGLDKGREKGGGRRGEGGAHQVDSDGHRELEREEGGWGGRMVGRGVGEGFLQGGREGKEGVVGGLRVFAGLLGEEGIEA